MSLDRRTPVFLALSLAGAGTLVSAAAPSVAFAQEPSTVVGDWTGTLQVPGGTELVLTFHLSEDEEGALSATLDVPAQGAMGVPMGDVDVASDSLRIQAPALGASFEGVRTAGDTIEGRWSQGGAVLPLTLVRGEEEGAGPARPQHPVPPFPYRVEEVRFPNPAAAIELAGTLTLPPGEGPWPAVVLISGSGPQDRDETVFGHKPFAVLADHLTRSGIGVLRYDDRGVGESGGSFPTATSEDFASDVRAAVSYLVRREEVASDAVGLVGHSEGGLVAPMVAAGSDRVDFLVLLAAPGVPGLDILRVQTALMARAAEVPERRIEMNRLFLEEAAEVVATVPAADRADSVRAVLTRALEGVEPEELTAMGLDDPETRNAFVRQQAQQMASPWMAFFLEHDPRPVLREVSVPVLALNGALDLQVSPEQNLPEIRRALAEGGNDRAIVEELPGLNHLFQPASTGAATEYASIEVTIAEEVLERISSWIREVTGA